MEHIVVDLKRTSGNVHFEAVSADHPAITIPFDYTPPLGSGDGLSGLEALVMTFCGCVSTAIIGLTLRLGKHIGQCRRGAVIREHDHGRTAQDHPPPQ